MGERRRAGEGGRACGRVGVAAGREGGRPRGGTAEREVELAATWWRGSMSSQQRGRPSLRRSGRASSRQHGGEGGRARGDTAGRQLGGGETVAGGGRGWGSTVLLVVPMRMRWGCSRGIETGHRHRGSAKDSLTNLYLRSQFL
jgi:hypothetical protein